MIDAERALVAALLGETTPCEAAERMCAALSREPGVTWSLREGHDSSERGAPDDSTMRVPLGTSLDGTSCTLVITGAASLDPAMRKRATRLFERLIEIAFPMRSAGKTLHQLNNGVAALLANLEFIELLVEDARSEPLDERQRDELSTAVAHGLDSCRNMRTLLRTLANLDG